MAVPKTIFRLQWPKLPYNLRLIETYVGMIERRKAAGSVLLPLFLLLLPLLNGCATIPYDYPRTLSTALYLPEATSMGKKIQAQVEENHGASGFYLLSSGEDAFFARVRLINRAEKTLDLQYYLFSADLTGKFLLDRIIAAAERGVRVRLLLDDWGETAEMDRWLTMMEIYPSIEVRIFNPFGGLRSNLLTRSFGAIFGAKRLKGRMHNKAFIVDNSVAIVGGRNIADEYFEASSGVNFSDMDIMAEGPIVRQVSAVFDDYWNCVLSIPLKALVSHRPTDEEVQKARHDLEAESESLKKSSYAVKVRESDLYLLKHLVEPGMISFVWAQGDVLFDDPLKVINSDDRERTVKMRRELGAFLQEAQSELLIISPYLVPGKAGVQWFQKMRDRGVTVKIITNSLASTDSSVAQFGYMRYRKDFLRMGVELYELRATPGPRGEDRFRIGGSSRGALHAKTIVLDGRAVFVGSFNLDLRSARSDTQNGIVVHSPELAEQAAGIFNKDASPTRTYRVTLVGDDILVWVTAENGREVRYYREPMAGFWLRFSGRFFYVFIPESML